MAQKKNLSTTPQSQAYSDLELNGVAIADLVRVYLVQYRSGSYFTCPSVLLDRRLVSVRAKAAEARSVVETMLMSMGYVITEKGGIVNVCSGSDSGVSQPGVVDAQAGPVAQLVVPSGGGGYAGALGDQAVQPVDHRTRKQRLEDVGATGYLPRIIHDEGSSAPIHWPKAKTYSCPMYWNTNMPGNDPRCKPAY